MDNATSIFLGPEAEWALARIDLHDIQGLWGGQAIAVLGSGEVRVERVGPAFPTERFTFQAEASQVRTLFQAFITHDFLSIVIPLRPGLPDEAHPQIKLTNAAGQSQTVSKWAGQTDEGFDSLYREIVTVVSPEP
jgi:hypothetical protein